MVLICLSTLAVIYRGNSSPSTVRDVGKTWGSHGPATSAKIFDEQNVLNLKTYNKTELDVWPFTVPTITRTESLTALVSYFQ